MFCFLNHEYFVCMYMRILWIRSPAVVLKFACDRNGGLRARVCKYHCFVKHLIVSNRI